MLAWLFAVPFLILANMVLAAEGPNAPETISKQATMTSQSATDDQPVKEECPAPIGISTEPENAAIESDAAYQAQLAEWNALSPAEQTEIREALQLYKELHELGLGFQKILDDLSNPPTK